MMYFKVLENDGSCHNGGSGRWSLPTLNDDGTWTPGDWMPEIEGDLEPCENGYHLCREQDLVHWLGPAIFEAEYRGGCLEYDDKVVVREARLLRQIVAWDERSARLFACDCAERVLHIYEREYPADDRPRKAVGVARKYANGEATDAELTAARDATWAAARDAAWDTAWAAAQAAAQDTAQAAAQYAARAAAQDTAWAAAWYAARAAEREWQTARLIQYLNGDLP